MCQYKNLKPIFSKSKWHPHKLWQEPNEEIHIDFGGPILNEKDKEIYFLTCIDRYSKYPTVEIFEDANGRNVFKFLREYAYNHGLPRTISLDQETCLVGKQVTNYCNEHNINILDAPVGDHRAIGLVVRMIQTIKRRLSCMKAENKETFSTSNEIKQTTSDLRLTKQKTTKITPFEAHFGRPANTPLKNISTVPSSLNLTYEKFINHYLDADTVPAEDFLDEAGWINPDRSDLEIETSICRAQDAGRRYRDSSKKESRFIIHPKISNQIPRSEASLNVKLARKLPNKNRAKRQHAGLYEVLKPGSYVTKSSPTATIINEPGRAPVKARDSDLAKFGTKAERANNLWTYAQRRPAPYEQNTETKMAKQSNDLKKQKRGEIKNRHRQRDITSVVSSVNSIVTRALTVRKPSKPQPNCRRTTASLNEPSEIISHDKPGTSSVPAPPVPKHHEQPGSSLVSDSQTQNVGRKRTRPQFYGFSEADVSPTSSLASSSSSKTKNENLENKIRKVQHPMNR